MISATQYEHRMSRSILAQHDKGSRLCVRPRHCLQRTYGAYGNGILTLCNVLYFPLVTETLGETPRVLRIRLLRTHLVRKGSMALLSRMLCRLKALVGGRLPVASRVCLTNVFDVRK